MFTYFTCQCVSFFVTARFMLYAQFSIFKVWESFPILETNCG